MRLDSVRIEDVHDFNAPHFQVIGNQGTMTTPPDHFCAHNSHGACFAKETKKALDAVPGTFWDEERGLNDQHYIVPGGGGFGEILNNAYV